jgi:UDP-galactopyranose mutase
MKFDFVIVGAGFAGCVLAERAANVLGRSILLVEQRDHIGGNAYDYYNKAGILVQKYGPHIFHTNSKNVWDYLSKFTEWNSYTHKVLAKVNGKEVPLPINLETMELLYSRDFTSKTLKDYFGKNRIKVNKIENSRDVVISQVGEEIYELFFKNYTKKQWGVYPDELAPEVTGRLKTRLNRDTRYFTDSYQGIPKYGYTRMFERMLDNKNIRVLLNKDYKDVIESVKFNVIIFTGAIDCYFDYRFGKLPYRSLDFRFETLDLERYQNAGVINYPNEHNYTRITEFKQLYLQSSCKTTICYEYPASEGPPYYPIPKPENKKLYLKYKKEAKKLENAYFVGRLARYKYLNMDRVVADALVVFDEQIKISLTKQFNM